MAAAAMVVVGVEVGARVVTDNEVSRTEAISLETASTGRTGRAAGTAVDLVGVEAYTGVITHVGARPTSAATIPTDAAVGAVGVGAAVSCRDADRAAGALADGAVGAALAVSAGLVGGAGIAAAAAVARARVSVDAGGGGAAVRRADRAVAAAARAERGGGAGLAAAAAVVLAGARVDTSALTLGRLGGGASARAVDTGAAVGAGAAGAAASVSTAGFAGAVGAAGHGEAATVARQLGLALLLDGARAGLVAAAAAAAASTGTGGAVGGTLNGRLLLTSERRGGDERGKAGEEASARGRGGEAAGEVVEGVVVHGGPLGWLEQEASPRRLAPEGSAGGLVAAALAADAVVHVVPTVKAVGIFVGVGKDDVVNP